MDNSNLILESPKSSSESQVVQQIGGNMEVGEIKKIKPPPFWQTKPSLWFAQVDAQFFANNIRSDNVKYYTIVAALDSQVLEQVSDVVESSSEKEKYQVLRKQLILRFTDSEVKQLRKLLSEVELGDKKPSQLLREMKILAKEVSQDVLRTLWIQRLPVRVQVVLSINEDAELEKLAEMADKIVEISYTTSSIQEVKKVSTTLASSASENQNSSEINLKVTELEKQIAAP